MHPLGRYFLPQVEQSQTILLSNALSEIWVSPASLLPVLNTTLLLTVFLLCRKVVSRQSTFRSTNLDK